MADVYKGLTIKFGAETTGLDAALKDINKRSTDIGRELGQVNRLLKLDPRSTELLGQKQKLLADKIGATKQRLEALKQSQDKIAAMYKSGEIDEGAYRHFQRQIIDTELELKRLEAVGKKSAAEVGKAMQAAGKKMKTVGGDIKSAGQTATMGLTVPILAAGTAAVALGALFEQSMNQVQAATEAPAAQMESLNALALKLGADTVFSAGEAAGAMLELAKAGITPAQIEAGALSAALTLAAAGGVSLESAATTTANALNMFGLEAARSGEVANAFAGGANASSASVESLQQALSQVGPGAKNAGLSLQDTVGVLASFADKGIQGSDAGTSLKTMLQRLIPQTAEAGDAMKALGLNFVDAHGSFLPIGQIAEQLKRKLGGLTQAERANALQTIFGSDATRAATVLMDEGAKGIGAYIVATKDQAAAQSMADARMKGTAGTLENMRGSLESAAIVISETLAPMIQRLAGYIKGLADSFAALPASSRESILVFVGIAAAIGPLLVIIGTLISSIGSIAGAIGGLVGVFGALSTAISAAGGIMAVLTGPIAIVIGIIAALVVGLVILNAHTDAVAQSSSRSALEIRDMGLAADVTAAYLGRTSAIVRDFATANDESAYASERAAAGIEAVKYASEQSKGALAQLRVEVDHNNAVQHQLEASTLAVARAQARVDDLRKAGRTGTMDYREAVNQLAQAHDALKQKQNDAATSDTRLTQAEIAAAEALRLKGVTTTAVNASMKKMANEGLAALTRGQGAFMGASIGADEQTAKTTRGLAALGIKWAGAGQAVYSAKGKLIGWNQTPSKDKKPNTSFVPVRDAIADANRKLDEWNRKSAKDKSARVDIRFTSTGAVSSSGHGQIPLASGAGPFNSPTDVTLGDGDGPEWAISSDPRYKTRNLGFLAEAAAALGVSLSRLSGSSPIRPSSLPAGSGGTNITVNGLSLPGVTNARSFIDELSAMSHELSLAR